MRVKITHAATFAAASALGGAGMTQLVEPNNSVGRETTRLVVAAQQEDATDDASNHELLSGIDLPAGEWLVIVSKGHPYYPPRRILVVGGKRTIEDPLPADFDYSPYAADVSRPFDLRIHGKDNSARLINRSRQAWDCMRPLPASLVPEPEIEPEI